MPTDKNRMRAAIYARVSTTDQNCDLQLRELREYVTRRGWESAGEFVDAGVSGAKASRPALNRLMTAAARREFDCVLVYKIDRFGRSVLHLSQQLAALTSYGVRFIAVSQAIDTDAPNSSSRLMLTILAGVAEFEREIIRERTLSGVRAAKARGKPISFQASVDETLDHLVRNQLEDFAGWLRVAWALYRKFPDLVTAPEFPEPFRSMLGEAGNPEPTDDTWKEYCPELLDPAALRETLQTKAREMALNHMQRTGRPWRKPPEDKTGA